jgi:2'-5' RNA ligase
MRIFIAVNLSTAVKDKINALIENLKLLDPKIKWVTKENLHLTLKFLGETSEEVVAKIGRALSQATQATGEFEIKIKGIGTFSRVIWAAVENGKAPLEKLYAEVEAAAETAGFKRENRPFAAHITLGRIKEKASPALRTKIGQLKEIDLGADMVKTVAIIKSNLTRQGPVYENIADINLIG